MVYVCIGQSKNYSVIRVESMQNKMLRVSFEGMTSLTGKTLQKVQDLWNLCERGSTEGALGEKV